MLTEPHKWVHLCQRCPRRGPIAGGPCLCLEDNKDILEHEASGVCPLDYFAHPELMPKRKASQDATPIPLAGDMVEAVAKKVGADRLAKWWTNLTGKDCGCADRKRWLNRISERLIRRFTAWA